MLLIGLTGSIATGKSTVSALLAAPPYSLPIIDADVLARQVVEPGTAGYRAIVAAFGRAGTSSQPKLGEAEGEGEGQGEDILIPVSATMPEHGPDGKGRPLDRAALGRRVFGTSEAAQARRRTLNSIVHPAVRRAMATAVLRAYLAGHWAVVLDVPLLFDSGLDIFCGAVIVVAVSDGAVQLHRLLARDHAQGGTMTEDEARARVASQGDVMTKVARVRVRIEKDAGNDKGDGANNVASATAASATAATTTPAAVDTGTGSGAILWNDGSKDELNAQVAAAVAGLRSGSPRWWSTLLWLSPPLALLAALRAYWKARAARRQYESNKAGNNVGKKSESTNEDKKTL